MTTTGASSVFFTKLEKYSGDIHEDLQTWIREFERCCIIANKQDPEVKGQYLMLCVGGRAKAVLEKFEAEINEAQEYDALKAELERVFESTVTREAKMSMFENRMLQVGETEENFMLEILKLYRNANPDATGNMLDAALKRKFLQGLPPNLKRNIFIFCNDPYNTGVTRDQLLEACRKAKALLDPNDTSEMNGCAAISGGSMNDGTRELANSIQQLSLQLDSHISSSNEHSAQQAEHLAAISRRVDRFSSNRYNFNRGRGNFRYRGSRGNNRRYRGNDDRRNTNISRTNSQQPTICFKCGGQYHLARHCLMSSSGNE